jgi:hypothetical protein
MFQFADPACATSHQPSEFHSVAVSEKSIIPASKQPQALVEAGFQPGIFILGAYLTVSRCACPRALPADAYLKISDVLSQPEAISCR